MYKKLYIYIISALPQNIQGIISNKSEKCILLGRNKYSDIYLK